MGMYFRRSALKYVDCWYLRAGGGLIRRKSRFYQGVVIQKSRYVEKGGRNFSFKRKKKKTPLYSCAMESSERCGGERGKLITKSSFAGENAWGGGF